MLEAHIIVISMEGKDPTSVANYQPISLLNAQLKILANWLLPLLPTLVAYDQISFVPSREVRNNIFKALNRHNWLSSTKHQGFFLSLDEEKAFHRVSWDYMAA